jgi:hypothetical protein
MTALGALAGPPISGAVRTSSNGWEMVGIYAGRFFNYYSQTFLILLS